MAKQTGLGDQLYVGGFDLSGDIGSLGAIGGGPNAGEVTAINKSAKERRGLLRDGRMEFNSWFDPDVGAAHDVLANLPTADVGVLYTRGTAVGSQAAGMIGKQIDYAPTRGEDGSLELAINVQANGFGLEWGTLYTDGLDTFTVAGAGAVNDAGAAVGTTLFGAQIYVQVTAFTGTGAIVTLQSSTDNGVGDPWADVAGAGAVVGATGSFRSQSSAGTTPVERYTRLNVTSFGGFSSITFVAMAVRNLTARAF